MPAPGAAAGFSGLDNGVAREIAVIAATDANGPKDRSRPDRWMVRRAGTSRVVFNDAMRMPIFVITGRSGEPRRLIVAPRRKVDWRCTTTRPKRARRRTARRCAERIAMALGIGEEVLYDYPYELHDGQVLWLATVPDGVEARSKVTTLRPDW